MCTSEYPRCSLKLLGRPAYSILNHHELRVLHLVNSGGFESIFQSPRASATLVSITNLCSCSAILLRSALARKQCRVPRGSMAQSRNGEAVKDVGEWPQSCRLSAIASYIFRGANDLRLLSADLWVKILGRAKQGR